MTISEIKKEAKSKLQGKMLKSCVIYLAYSLIVGLLQAANMFFSSNTLRVIYSLVIIILSLPFSYGAIAQLIKLSRGEDASVTGFINIGLQSLGKVWGILGRTLLKLIVPIILYILSIVFFIGIMLYVFASTFSTNPNSIGFEGLFLVALVLFIAALIYLFAKSLLYYLTMYILYDNQESTSKEIVEKSAELMAGNRWKYIGFALSFIGWYLLIYVISLILIYVNPILGTIVMLIFTLILMQYITFATIVFYEDLAGITSNTEVKE